MTVRELRKILKQCEHQDAELKFWGQDGSPVKVSRVAESSVLAQVEIFLTEDR